jgi:multidrug efflux system outer membrane protein
MEALYKFLHVGIALFVAGCAVNPHPLCHNDRAARIRQDSCAMFGKQEPVSRTITLAEATARALKYNLDLRVKAADAVLARGDLEVSNYDMLPNLVASAGYIDRSNEYAVRSSPSSNITSFSEDRHRHVLDLQMTWNILDFGVSWINSKQKADQYLISLERRRKMQQNVVRDVRYAFYRTVSAQKLLRDLNPLVSEVKIASEKSHSLEKSQTMSPVDALRYQKSLISTLRELTTIQRELTNAKKELAALMTLPPNQEFTVDESGQDSHLLPNNFPMQKERLEYLALQYRPEIREEDYNRRISCDDVTKAKMRLLPGLELNAGENYDSNSFLVHTDWANYGARLTWKLLKLLSGPSEIKRAQSDVAVKDLRRMALAMAILTQTDIAYVNYHQLGRDLKVARSEKDISARLYNQVREGFHAQKNSELELIQSKTDKVLAQLRYDLTYAEYQNTAAQLMSSTGYDILPILDTHKSVTTLTHQIRSAFGHTPTWVVEMPGNPEKMRKKSDFAMAPNTAPTQHTRIADATEYTDEEVMLY